MVLSEGLTKLQAAKDPKDQPHRVVQRQDRVDHVISCDPTQGQHPAYLQRPLVREDGWLREPWGKKQWEEWGGAQTALEGPARRSGSPGSGLHSQGSEALERWSSMGPVGAFREDTLDWSSEAEFQSSGFQWLFTGQRQDSGTDHSNNTGGQSSARCQNQRAGWVSEVKFESQVRLGVMSAEGFRGWARTAGRPHRWSPRCR